MQLGLVVTDRCNARCLHCSTSCAPDRTSALPAATIARLMDEAAALRSKCDPCLEFCISGGEPFLDYKTLLAIISYGNCLGAQVTCVTNGYWATSEAKARARLSEVKNAGLSRLGISTSRFHQQFVKLRTVERALRVARELGLPTVLKCAITRRDRSGGNRLAARARAAGADELELFPIVPYLRQGHTLPNEEYLRPRKLPRGRCPAPLLTIREDGEAYSCGTAGAMTEFLAIGYVHRDPLAELQGRFVSRGRQRILRERGPGYFARKIMASGKGNRLRARYAGICDLCAHIASDPELQKVAEHVADEYETRVLRAAWRHAAATRA